MSAAGRRLSIIPAGAVLDSRLARGDLQVLAVFGSYTDRAGWCFRSQVKMAREIGIARSTLQLSIDRLVAAGWLERRLNGGLVPEGGKERRDLVQAEGARSQVYEYRVVLDPIDDGSPDPLDNTPPPPADRSAPLPTDRQVNDADLPIHRSAPPADPMRRHLRTSPINEKSASATERGRTGRDRRAGDERERGASSVPSSEQLYVSAGLEPELYVACSKATGHNPHVTNKRGGWLFDRALVNRLRVDLAAGGGSELSGPSRDRRG